MREIVAVLNSVWTARAGYLEEEALHGTASVQLSSHGFQYRPIPYM